MSARHCPTCGQVWPEKVILTAADLVAALRLAGGDGKPRDVYEGCDQNNTKKGGGGGRYFITYGGGEVSRAAIDDALERGLIRNKWPDLHDCYWCLTEENAE